MKQSRGFMQSEFKNALSLMLFTRLLLQAPANLRS
jgi:hypothetical protein